MATIFGSRSWPMPICITWCATLSARLLDVQAQADPRAAMAQVLAGADRRYAGVTAPGCGPVLVARGISAACSPSRPYSRAITRRANGLNCGMSWFERIVPSRIKTERRTRSVPEGLWTKCPACDAVLYKAEIERNLHVCPKCSHHMRINGRERVMKFLDPGSTTEIAAKVEPEDPLKFKDSKRYKDRIGPSAEADRRARCADRHGRQTRGTRHRGVRVRVSFSRRLHGIGGRREIRACGGTLPRTSHAPGVFSASGGARMQEALYSLLQMAKTSAALKRLSEARLPFISVMTDPTMGGVSASLAMLGDVNIGEPKALIGFRRPARHSTDGARDLAGRISAQRVSARARRARHDRRSARTARPHRRHAAVADRQRTRRSVK